jgi:hypothetical protein
VLLAPGETRNVRLTLDERLVGALERRGWRMPGALRLATGLGRGLAVPVEVRCASVAAALIARPGA